MGRQSSSDATTKVSSSIALLQERFRQLQKVKERREEKEQLRKKLSESTERVSPIRHFDDPSSNMSLHHHHNRPTPPLDHQSLSLGLDLQSKQSDDDICAFTSLWPNTTSTASASASSSKSFDNSDIDTSLHL